MPSPGFTGRNARRVDVATRKSGGSLPAIHARILLVGAGRVGTAVAELLRRRGHSVVGVVSRSPVSRERATRLVGGPGLELGDRLPDFDVCLLGVADAALSEVVPGLVPDARQGRIFCHFSGSQGIAPLSGLLEAGSEGCAMHPVQAVPSIDAGLTHLAGSSWGVTGSSEAVAWARRLIHEDLGGNLVEVAEADRAVWHAASVTTSNGIAALMALGERILSRIGYEDPEAILGPLAAGTVSNAREGGGGAATLTGPVVRGERETIERHLSALLELDRDLAGAYISVATSILGEARISERIGEEQAALLD